MDGSNKRMGLNGFKIRSCVEKPRLVCPSRFTEFALHPRDPDNCGCVSGFMQSAVIHMLVAEKPG